MSMLTLPKLIERAPQSYVALRRTVRLPFGSVVDATLPELWRWIGAHDIEPVGPPFFKYNLIDMDAENEIEFGVPTATVLQPDGEVVTGTLPGGRYASITYRGHYDRLIEVTAMLQGWMSLQGYRSESEQTPEGERFASRLEIYPTDPQELPDPDDWETVLAFKVRE